MKKILAIALTSLISVAAYGQNGDPENGTENNLKIRHVYCAADESAVETCYVAFRRPLGVVCGGHDWRISLGMLSMVLANPNGRYNATCQIGGANLGQVITQLWLVP